ncbi:nSTAND1 domain-containing NTPase [Gordonia sp. HS-NH1]|uniref:nSTAND1 domain-containing NTPase n=1 Tax=Gordonia sp. HS-NH1 TaxID=1435068 RepID=UPI0012E322BF|nr:pentapeptide repeat-containing protein [Gordonia sp. HS-NH1]
MSLLNEWRESVLDATKSPWPGPRPMKEDRYAARQLIGRDTDIKKFKRLLFDTDVVVFTGASGVGKTSMLQVGLVPDLRESGYTVIVCNKWSRRSDEIAAITGDHSDHTAKADQLLQALLSARIPVRARLGLSDGESLLSALDTYYRDKCVVVLDQFEELMRYQPDAFQWLLRWIENAASLTKIRIVVSLRVEHEHQLNGSSGLRLGPFSQKRYELPPITKPEHVREIVESPNSSRAEALGDLSLPVISASASKRIESAWTKAGEEGAPQDRGLLHLQALLFALWMRGGGRCIEASDVTKHFPKLNGAALFKAALAEAVEVSVDKCSEACISTGIPDVLAARAKHYVRAMSVHLSSGGFKVDHSREDLAQLVVFRESLHELSAEARNLGEQARHRLATLVDESMAESSIAPLTLNNDWVAIQRESLLGAEVELPADLGDLTAGVLLGRSPVESLLEEYRAFYFAIEWLRLCELIRITTPEENKTMVSLIHDLFGAGLIQWSSTQGGAFGGLTAENATHQFSVLRGVRMSWKNLRDKSFLEGRLLVNQRWKYCDVSGDFRGVTFANCDFQGTVFRDCTFDGVQFVNCTLDDVELLDCTVHGAPIPTPASDDIPADIRAKLGAEPSFFIGEADTPAVGSLLWYAEPRLPGGTPHRIYSMPGVAAVASAESTSMSELPFEPQPGGLTMFGGRLSSLKIRNCNFARKGQISLRHAAGTSVELAEQKQVRLSMFDVALRGLTITRPVGYELQSKPRDFVLEFTESHLINTWFGVGLRGSATFDWCVVWQVLNAADREDFKVRMPKGRQYGVVNIEPLQDWQRLSMSETSLGNEDATENAPAWDGRLAVRAASQKMDYRR